jgi:predicted metal-dependent hydrolase
MVQFEMDIIRRRVKYPRIEIKPDGKVRVIAPKGYDVDGFVKRKQGWIDKKLKEIKDLERQAESNDGRLLLNGLSYELKHGDVLEIDNIKHIIITPDFAKLSVWIKEKIREEVTYKTRLLSKLIGVSYSKIYIRRQKTRWASCSGKGNLSFNMAMLALPETLKEYIVIHELSHQVERNHSKRFWKVVEQHYPNYKKAREELKRYSLILGKSNLWRGLSSF